jgi:hypothetical protein
MKIRIDMYRAAIACCLFFGGSSGCGMNTDGGENVGHIEHRLTVDGWISIANNGAKSLHSVSLADEGIQLPGVVLEWATLRASAPNLTARFDVSAQGDDLVIVDREGTGTARLPKVIADGIEARARSASSAAAVHTTCIEDFCLIEGAFVFAVVAVLMTPSQNPPQSSPGPVGTYVAASNAVARGLQEACTSEGCSFLQTEFDMTAVDFDFKKIQQQAQGFLDQLRQSHPDAIFTMKIYEDEGPPPTLVIQYFTNFGANTSEVPPILEQFAAERTVFDTTLNGTP